MTNINKLKIYPLMGYLIKLIFLLILISSCNKHANITDSNASNSDSSSFTFDDHLQNKLVAEYDPIEEQDYIFFDSLLHFFEMVIKDRTGKTQTDSAYHTYMESLKYKGSYEGIMKVLTKDKDKVDSFIKQNNDSEIFYRYFRLDYYYSNQELTDTVAYEYNPNHYSSYMNLLKEAIKIDSSYKEYSNLLWSFGSIPPTLFNGYNYYNSKLDFNIEIIRLITAIHYMCLISYTEID